MTGYFVLFGVSCAIIFTCILMLFIEWICHLDMTKRYTDKWGYGNYQLFIQHFNLHSWKISRSNGTRFYTEDDGTKFHASIVSFNGIGMIIWNPIDYFRILWFTFQYARKHNIKVKPVRHEWKEPAKIYLVKDKEH